jgi:hypothetical protein
MKIGKNKIFYGGSLILRPQYGEYFEIYGNGAIIKTQPKSTQNIVIS